MIWSQCTGTYGMRQTNVQDADLKLLLVLYPSGIQIGLLLPWRASANVCTVQVGLLVQYILVAAIEDNPLRAGFALARLGLRLAS